jgi:GNAT superfamily N-acetyltransferase
VAGEDGAPRTVLGYFTLAMASVPRDASPRNTSVDCRRTTCRCFCRHRLAVDRRFAGRGLGHALLSEVFRLTLRPADQVACRSIVTDAYRDRMRWYERYGFVPIESGATGPQRLFLDVRTIRAAKRS